MSVNAYAEQVVRGFITDITDHLFLSIEHDEAKMRDYMDNVARFGKRELNKTIGKKIEVLLKLDGVEKKFEPKSMLLTEYTRYKTKQHAHAMCGAGS